MAFEIDPDRPNIPGIARLLSWFGILLLIGSISLMLLAFSGFPWVDQNLAVIAAIAAFVVAVMMTGQAKTIELLAVVSARVKSRFAIEHALMPKPAMAEPAEKKLPTATQATPARVISIPEQVAREQGLTRNPEPRDFR